MIAKKSTSINKYKHRFKISYTYALKTKIKSNHIFSYFLVDVSLKAYIIRVTQCILGKMKSFEFNV